ncbi:MAG TPA: UDP-N-acetylglucosamine--N-acetylmuramyl-(pentapeptide) pyrophosphoryl-undecaprenol N-acetylglucosamine transferase [Gemmatimonadales bacterium]|nr:UDP-N-acetylglucosamine--N-acetylmuramyl-(pentapeptide) pyrophosphoryl-undecaprenol N-acetylglucosamine transferase [Gemmatimonadales bacterium]
MTRDPRPATRTVLIAGGGTGGHLIPALAIAKALRESGAGVEPVLVGAERGVESWLLPERDFPYHLLPIRPLFRQRIWRNAALPWILLRTVAGLRRIFRERRPALVVGTGGYASGPAVWWAARRGIPVAIQEQNAWPGLATRMLAGRVDHIYLGAPEARARLRPGRHTAVFDTGNPITPPDPARRAGAQQRFGLTGRERVLLVTGASQGAVPINRAVAGWLDAGGAADTVVLWATGKGSYEEFRRYHRPPAVQVFDFLDPIADAYAVADLAVARGGMMTGAELCAWGIPSIIIPLPTAADDHQTANALALELAGAARHLPQAELNATILGRLVDELLADGVARAEMAERARERGRPRAAADIVSHCLTLLGAGHSFATAD